MTTMTHIGDHPLPEMYKPGLEIDCQCARCGSSCDYTTCHQCGGEGVDGHDCGEDCCCCLYPEENVTCETCLGHGGWNMCLSSPEFCLSNPLPGREKIERGEIEWYAYEDKR